MLTFPSKFECGMNTIFHLNWSFVWKIVAREDQDEFTHKIRNSFDLKHSFDIKCTLVFEEQSVFVIMRGKPQINRNELEIAGMFIEIGAIINDQKMQDEIDKFKEQIAECNSLIDQGQELLAD